MSFSEAVTEVSCNLNKSLLGIETGTFVKDEVINAASSCNLNKSLLGIETRFMFALDLRQHVAT